MFFQSANQFEKKLNRAIEENGFLLKENRRPEGYQEAPLAYDAVWAVALGKVFLLASDYLENLVLE